MTEKILNIKKLNNDSVLPTKGSEYAAGMDLYAYIPNGAIVIPAGKTVKIGTGIATEIPTGCFGAVFARSGDRIAQLVIMPYIVANLCEVDELSDTVRGDGGFGSTGTR